MVIYEELWTGDCLEPQLCFATNFVTFLAILEGVFLSAKIRAPLQYSWASLVAQAVKNLPAL